jgi:uncharacterized protein YprB with RNaseH-like and TPR domain
MYIKYGIVKGDLLNKILSPAEYVCPHRHTGLEHPNCYVKYLNGAEKTCYLDIETSGLSADMNFMLSYAVKERGGKVYADSLDIVDFINTSAYGNGELDRRLVKDLVDTLFKYDTVVTYYGSNFDIPFIRTKAMGYHIEFPPYKSLRHVDLYYVVRSKMKLMGNRLGNATNFLGIEGKNSIETKYWRKALTGNKSALGYIKDHNIRDVLILEKLHNRLLPYTAQIRRSI